MDLSAYSNEVAKAPSLRDVRSRAITFWDKAYAVIGNESRTDPTVAAVLSQIVLLSDEFSAALEQHHLDPKNDSRREVILVPRSSWGEYVLLVADDRFEGKGSSGYETLRLGEASLTRALWRWLQSVDEPPRKRGETEERLFDTYRTLSPAELIGIDHFTIHFVRRPPRVQTSVPIPAWEITSPAINGRATAGCIVEDASGRRSGVTSVRHFFPADVVTGTTVNVDGSPGTVAGEDLMSDSVFIQMPWVQAPAARPGVRGWLKGIAPRLGEIAMFDGATSHATKTAIMGLDPGVTQYSRHRQARIYTPPVTNPGDSGAALFEDSTDLIIGFAMERTEAGALIEWSSWIWADSVFTALNVSPR